MARKKILPIPLILLIPILLLIVVVLAGIYRFSLSDDEIMAKFPQTQVQVNPVLSELLGIQARHPWTVQVPEQGAVTFLDQWDKDSGLLKGSYDAGSVKGEVIIPTEFIRQQNIEGSRWIAAPFVVTTQGSGAFYYLGLFKFDQVPSRVVLLDSVLIGDRIKVSSLDWESDGQITLSYFQHNETQAMTESPNQFISRTFNRINRNLYMQR